MSVILQLAKQVVHVLSVTSHKRWQCQQTSNMAVKGVIQVHYYTLINQFHTKVTRGLLDRQYLFQVDVLSITANRTIPQTFIAIEVR